MDPEHDKQTDFPICEKKPESWPPKHIVRMGARAQAIIEEAQPFRVIPGQGHGTPAVHPLAVLHRLDIDDKHRVLTVTTGAVTGNTISGLPFGAEVEDVVWQGWIDGAVLARVKTSGATAGVPIGYVPYFDAVLAEPPLATANIMWVAEALLMNWVVPQVIDRLLPLAAPYTDN
ncbi:MAG: hypothetical protein ACYDAY_08330 [Candidatus Dormibacteria bacterium]